MNNPTGGHIVKRYDGELNHLHRLVLEMGALVIGQLGDALEAFGRQDVALARRVMTREREVDQFEDNANDALSKLLARRSPVSEDLRLVISVSKSVSDLESIGDEADRIAGLVLQLFDPLAGARPANGESHDQMLGHVERMGKMAMGGLQNALDVFGVWDGEKAFRVIDSYREMDEAFQAEWRCLITYILADSRNLGDAISMILLIKSFERIAHHSRNLVENIPFRPKGEVVKSP